jgi:hypothetical protein
MNIDGVGKESSQCSQSAVVPIVLADGRLATYTAPLLDDSHVPSLLGLKSMTAHRVLLDLVNDQYIMTGPGGFQLKLSPGSHVIAMKRAPTGHLMLPASSWDSLQGSNTQSGPSVALTAVPM